MSYLDDLIDRSTEFFRQNWQQLTNGRSATDAGRQALVKALRTVLGGATDAEPPASSGVEDGPGFAFRRRARSAGHGQTHVRLGALLLHGFTSDPSCFDGLVARLDEARIPHARPVLRGHGGVYTDLDGVTATDWYDDARRALADLAARVDRVVVLGYSMGGLVALDLAAREPDRVAGVITIAACVKFADPLARFAKRFATLVKYWPSPTSFADPALAETNRSYDRFPVATFASLYDYSRQVLDRLADVRAPIRLLQSRGDTVVPPLAAKLIYERVSSPARDIVWYARSGHSLIQDCEAEQAYADIVEFIESLARDLAEQPAFPRELRGRDAGVLTPQGLEQTQ